MKRTPLRRTRMKPWVRPEEGKVSPEQVALVIARDGPCVAVKLGEPASDCWGRTRMEHTKRQPRLGKRAESETGRLASICEGHSEPGMKAGRVWVTMAINRAKVRKWLADHA